MEQPTHYQEPTEGSIQDRHGASALPPDGDIAGPPGSATSAPRAHTVIPRPRRVTTHRSWSPPQRSLELAVSSFMRSRRARGPGKLPTPHQPHPKPSFTGNASAEQGDATYSKAAGLKYDGSNEQRYAHQVIFHIASVQSTNSLSRRWSAGQMPRSGSAGPNGEVEGRPTAPLERRGRIRFSRARGACGSWTLQRLSGTIAHRPTTAARPHAGTEAG